MLVGNFTYKNYRYNVQAYDFDDSVACYLIPQTSEAAAFLDRGVQTESGETIPREWDTELYVTVGLGNVGTSLYIYKEDKSKYKNRVNQELLIAFGSIIRGMKASSDYKNMENLDANALSQILKFNMKWGYTRLRIQTLIELKYHNDETGTDLYLEEDGTYDTKIRRQTNTLQRFKLDLTMFGVGKKEEEESDDWEELGKDHIYTMQEIIERNKGKKSYDWLKTRKYYIVNDHDEMVKICKEIWNHEGKVAFDTETTGLKVNVTSRQGLGDRLVGMIFSIKPGVAWYFPVANKKFKNICDEGNENYIITKYFKPILETKEILAHNGAYDWKVMYNYGINMNLKRDDMILFKVTMGNDNPTLKLGLKSLTHQFLHRDSFELSDFVEGKFGENSVKFWDLDEESVKYYACPDCDNLIELDDLCESMHLLDKYDAAKIYRLEVAFSKVKAYQEYYGHCIDVDRMDKLTDDLKKEQQDELHAMEEILGRKIDPKSLKSSKDLPKILFEELKIPTTYSKKSAAGNWSTAKDVRKRIADAKNADGESLYPFVDHLSKYLDATTLISNFINNVDKFGKEYGTKDGLMFSEVEQFLATGRISVKNPNYQGYSDVVKHYVIPREGYYMFDADYSSVEARIMTSWAGCKDMIEKLKDPDTDYHTMKASQMFDIPYELVTHSQRKKSKAVNFGILYGLSDYNLAKRLDGVEKPTNKQVEHAVKQKESYFNGMSELKVFIEKSREMGVTKGYSTTYFGRRRYFNKQKLDEEAIKRQSCNARVQGTAADIYKTAMVRLFNKICKNGWLGKVLISGFIHDECLLEVSRTVDPMILLKTVRDSMMLPIKGWTTLFTGTGFGHNWYEAKSTEIPVQVQEYFSKNFGETGWPDWDGDTDHLCNYVVDTIHNYSRDRVIDYLKDSNNYHKVLAPAVNALAHTVMEELESGAHIEGADITKVDKVQSLPDTVDNLKEFCKVFNCMDLFEKADVQRPTEQVDVSTDEHAEEDETEMQELEKENDPMFRVNLLLDGYGIAGIYNDDFQLQVYLDISKLNTGEQNVIAQAINDYKGDNPVYLRTKNGFMKYNTGISDDGYNKLRKTVSNIKGIG